MKCFNCFLFVYVFLLLFCLKTFSISAESTDLFISEYIEGTSNNKAIEIFNPTDNPINISEYKLQSYINGSSTVSGTATSSGVISPGGVFVFCNSSADQEIINKCNKTVSGVGTPLTFNGDDTLVLTSINGNIVDVIGQIGFDPGTEWGMGNVSTLDNTLLRKCSVNTGDKIASDSFEPESEWNGFIVNTFSDLGQHTLCLSTPEPTVEPTPLVTNTPTIEPTTSPTPTSSPTPSSNPTINPTPTPVTTPIENATASPTIKPTSTPIIHPHKDKHWLKLFIDHCSKFIHESLNERHKHQDNRWPSFGTLFSYNKHR